MDSRFFERVAMYLRKSRAVEGEETEVVLAKHRAQLSRYAAEHMINVVKIYEEVVSGDSLFSRPQMLQLLNDIENQEYTGVLCMDIDRLGRGNMKEQGLILETFKNSSTAIITPDKIYDLNNELDETQSEFKTFMARQELKMIKKRLSRGLHLTIEKGGYVSNIPFGYKRGYKNKVPTLVPDPEESKYVQMIFSLYNEGYGCQEICNRLNMLGVRPRRSDMFSRSSVRKILTNPVYIGKIVWGQKKHITTKSFNGRKRIVDNPKENWLVIDGLHQPIIDDETFETANALLQGKRHPPYRVGGVIMNPFSGLLFCRRCGRAMTRRAFGKNKAEYLLCPTTGCMKSSRLENIEHTLIGVLIEQLNTLSLQDENCSTDCHRINDINILENLKAREKKLQKQRNRLYDLLEQGIYTTEIFDERNNILTEQLNKLSAEIKTLEEKQKRKINQNDLSNIKITHLLQEYWNGTPEEKNKLLKCVIKKAFYYKAKNAGPNDYIIEVELRDVLA